MPKFASVVCFLAVTLVACEGCNLSGILPQLTCQQKICVKPPVEIDGNKDIAIDNCIFDPNSEARCCTYIVPRNDPDSPPGFCVYAYCQRSCLSEWTLEQKQCVIKQGTI